MMDVHILLVSQQAAANLLPTLDPALKPREVVLVVSESMKQRADDLEAVLKESGVKVSRVILKNEHDPREIEATLLDEIATNREGQAVALNATGGTKLMVLAAYAVAESAGWAVFYVDVDTDEVIWLDRPHQQDPGRQRLTTHLRLPHYLRGYGFRLPDDSGRAMPGAHCRHELTSTIITQIGSLEKPLRELNGLAQEAENLGRLFAPLAPAQQGDRGLEALLRNFEKAGALTMQDDRLTFPDAAARDFAKGGWLEWHVFRIVGSLSQDLQLRDVRANMVVRNGNNVKNELDIAFLARNRLFVIECKTARMDQTKANDALFKLAENCRRIGGLGTRGMLASYRGLHDAEKRLASALGMEVVCGEELRGLDERIKRWVRPRPAP